MRAFLVVLDSVGIGAAPDAADYGDEGANTLAHTAAAVGGLSLPFLRELGLGNIPPLLPCGLPIAGVDPHQAPRGGYGAMRELSCGKDTTTGHWEIAGLHLPHGLHLFPPGPPSFPDDLLAEFSHRTGRGVLGNKAASGTAIIEQLGERHMREGCWIVYTSADSVMQIAAHEDVIPLDELYRGCAVARDLCDPLHVGRVIARPFTGAPGTFRRTNNRRDFSLPPPEPTVLDLLTEAGVAVTTVGKLDDIFAGRGIRDARHVETNHEAMHILRELVRGPGDGLVFANLIDFDMLYGHRRDPVGYARALEEADRFLSGFAAQLRAGDVLIVTADHGNDPTFRGTDHTREFVPLLTYAPGAPPAGALGVREGFFDVAQSLMGLFGLAPMPRGRSFLPSRAEEGSLV
jgi:phosphopentomutase